MNAFMLCYVFLLPISHMNFKFFKCVSLKLFYQIMKHVLYTPIKHIFLQNLRLCDDVPALYKYPQM